MNLLPSKTPAAGKRVHSLCTSAQVFSSRSEEHTSELQSQSNLVCRLLLEKKKKNIILYVDSIPPFLYTAQDFTILDLFLSDLAQPSLTERKAHTKHTRKHTVCYI